MILVQDNESMAKTSLVPLQFENTIDLVGPNTQQTSFDDNFNDEDKSIIKLKGLAPEILQVAKQQ